MPIFDLHLHTSRYSPDSVIDPGELMERAVELGMDGVAITEHDHQWDDEELGDLGRRAPGLVVLSGAEISAVEGHFLVFGLPNLEETPPGVESADLLRVVERHRAAVVAAHPFRWDQPFDDILHEHGLAFDALELVSKNVTPETRRRTEGLLNLFPLGATGSSDGHAIDEVGCYVTEFPRRIRGMDDFVRALRDRVGRPRHLAGSRHPAGLVTESEGAAFVREQVPS